MYPSLAKMHKAGASNTWATVTCLNCASGAVYSIERLPSPMKETIQYPVDLQAAFRPGDKVIIHRDAIVSCTTNRFDNLLWDAKMYN